jgi:hypothetical protein
MLANASLSLVVWCWIHSRHPGIASNVDGYHRDTLGGTLRSLSELGSCNSTRSSEVSPRNTAATCETLLSVSLSFRGNIIQSYIIRDPPLLLTTLPVKFPSRIQNKYPSATSSGLPTRPVAIFFANPSKISPLCSAGNPSHNSVSTAPGEIRLTLSGRKSSANCLVKPCSP